MFDGARIFFSLKMNAIYKMTNKKVCLAVFLWMRPYLGGCVEQHCFLSAFNKHFNTVAWEGGYGKNGFFGIFNTESMAAKVCIRNSIIHHLNFNGRMRECFSTLRRFGFKSKMGHDVEIQRWISCRRSRR
ncbi:hypothetical protein DESC_800037 [Desulfosarcina cetonica]|nr:hypothetical protein DESC_800037 [Desulfosarcina cetonica]